ncbi:MULTISPECIES: four-carbon acid sugar kinase family protein [Aphanothece]|uniref:four-carbon acid sugar kinase family protein n=1 Tax=Aphanothece TaxID=1121 RepID=UPI003984E5E9
MKVVVLDDDPTGSQTVHGCPLLLRWDPATLRRGLAHPSPLLFVLANTRALAPAAARERVAGICRALRQAVAAEQAEGRCHHWLIVSRGDSTLRSHFPLECDVIAAELGAAAGEDPAGFDATFLAPAFLPGGRTTVNGVHRLNGEPVHTTPFARDGLFGYGSSDLAVWAEERSGGRIKAASVARLGLAALDAAAASPQGHRALCARLAALDGNRLVAVDAERPRQLAALGAAVRELTAPAASEGWGRPRRFLFQGAASLLNGLVDLPPQPLEAAGLAGLRRRGGEGALPGLVLVGSHVPLADAQLEVLLHEPGCAALELPVARLARLLEGPAPRELLASLEQAWREQLQACLVAGRTPVLHTSRGEVFCASPAERRRLGEALAALMARLAGSLAPQLGYVISKGGITTQALLSEGLDLVAVELQGQLLPGLSLVLTPAEARVPGLPVLTFPGNLGEAGTLRQAWRWMEGSPAAAAGG